MIHVWLIKPQSKLRVWNATTKQWQISESWQALRDTTMVKASDKEVCLYLSTQSVLSIVNELSASQVKQLGVTGQQYLFEDIALSAVEQLRVRHISQGVQQFFYALGASEVEQWQHQVQLAGFKITALLPDFVLLPVPQARLGSGLGSEMTLYQDQTDKSSPLLIRQSEAQGTSISHLSLLSHVLPKLMPNVDEISYLTTQATAEQSSLAPPQQSSQPNQAQPSDSANSYGIPEALKQWCDDNDIVITLSQHVPQPVANPYKHALNFVEIKRKRLASPYLTVAASVLLLAGVTQITADLIESYQYEQAAIATRAASDEQFGAWFEGEVLNDKVNVSSQVQPLLLKSGGEEQTQLATLNRISPIIKQSKLTAQSIEWNDSAISIVVKGASRDSIDQMQRTLSSQGVAINLGAVNPTSDGGVIADINVPLANADTAGSENQS